MREPTNAGQVSRRQPEMIGQFRASSVERRESASPAQTSPPSSHERRLNTLHLAQLKQSHLQPGAARRDDGDGWRQVKDVVGAWAGRPHVSFRW